jgi:excisionase family DNA binding protein
MTSILDSSNPHRLMSLASRIKAIHRALTAEELAELLQVARLTILRRAKRGSIPSFRVGSCVRFDSAAISKWLMQQGVQSMSNPTPRPQVKIPKKEGR